ncbi:MAG: 30S ribosomal protein S14 [Actinobacteria bacterium QS_5_72_10]|jgi:small subunit ribosomal protein S14|nr:MAG: 30S ribosomal protein S14 [Actinobacteria bacterium QS_5_72_10]
MAKKSKIAKNQQRRQVVDRQRERRAELKATLKDPEVSLEEKLAARDQLNKLDRDGSPTRVVNRDGIDGRPQAYMRKFGLSRINMRKLAHRGELPGVRKSSW